MLYEYKRSISIYKFLRLARTLDVVPGKFIPITTKGEHIVICSFMYRNHLYVHYMNKQWQSVYARYWLSETMFMEDRTIVLL